MPRRILICIMTMSLACLAHADIPDLTLSIVEIPAGAEGASIYCIPDGTGHGLDEGYLPGGAPVDATITVTLIDTNGDPVFLYPFEDMWLESTLGNLSYCTDGTVADASTDQDGQTTFSNPIAGGGYTDPTTEMTEVMIAGAPIAGGGVDVQFNSPDISGDLTVGLTDITIFAQLLGGNHDSHPLFAGDFNYDGVIDLPDIVRFTQAIGAECP